MGNRYLIINADDFGICKATNEAVEEIFEHGTITSTTVMTPCPYAQDAVNRAIGNSKINMGLHLTFNAEWGHKWGAISPKADVKSILDDDGYFYSAVKDFASHAKKEEVITEMYSQYNFLTSMGIFPTHADNHMGSLYGLIGSSFIRETLDFCAKTNLPFRFPKNKANIRHIIGGREIPKEIDELHTQTTDYAKMLGVPLIDNLFTNTVPFERLTCYQDLKNSYMNIIAGLEEGVSELYLHPSKEDFKEYSSNWIIRVWEYKFLLDGDLKKLIEKENIKLITWKDVSAPL